MSALHRLTGGRYAPAAGIILLGLIGCTEDQLTGVDPNTAPGDASETVEIELSAADLPTWTDTTFSGYALASTSGVRLVSNGADLVSRVLARFSTLPDSLFLDDQRIAVERFDNAALRLIVDTLASTIPETGAQLTAYALSRGFEDRAASWTNATATEPWTTPGGDLGDVIGTLQVTSLDADTVFLSFDVSSDSLLQAWLADDGEPGLALVAETAGTSLTFDQVVLSFDAKPVGRDTLIATLRSPAPSTFIFDPETPPPTGALRLGGLPAARAYINFRLPESVQGVKLRGARINRATLLLTSTGVPNAPFAASDTLFVSGFSLLTNPIEFGPKTPVGSNFDSSAEIDPEAMQDGGTLEIPITNLVRFWALSEPDSVPDINLGLRMLPEGDGLAFWEYGDVTDPVRTPRLRILVTPTTQFDLP